MGQFLSFAVVESGVPVWIASSFCAIVTRCAVTDNRLVLATNKGITEWNHTVVQFGTIVEESGVGSVLAS